MQINHTLSNGFPIIAEATRYQPGTPSQIHGPPEHCYEGDPEELEWAVTLKDGREAPDFVWRMINDDEEQRIHDALLKAIRQGEEL